LSFLDKDKTKKMQGSGMARIVTKPSFAIGKPFLRKPRGDTIATPEYQRMALARHASEIQKRRAIFAANASADATTPTNNP